MMAWTTRLHLFLLSALLACCSQTMASEPLKTQIEVFRVFPVFESEGSRRVARSELGCDPCEEIIYEDEDGSDARYFLDPEAGVRLGSTVIEDFGAESGEEGAVVFAILNEQGRSMIESLAAAEDDSSVNFANGEIIGLVPLRMFASRYLIALVPTASAAEKIVQRLRQNQRLRAARSVPLLVDFVVAPE